MNKTEIGGGLCGNIIFKPEDIDYVRRKDLMRKQVSFYCLKNPEDARRADLSIKRHCYSLAVGFLKESNDSRGERIMGERLSEINFQIGNQILK